MLIRFRGSGFVDYLFQNKNKSSLQQLRMRALLFHRLIPFMESDCLELQFRSPRTYSGGWPVIEFNKRDSSFLESRNQIKRYGWRVPFALDTGTGNANDQGNSSLDGDNAGLGRTRLGAIVRAAARQLLDKLNGARKNFPTKIFLLLLGFYTANALATILGQTGDWDVLVAGVVVAAIEGIGMVMYRKPRRMLSDRLRSLMGFVNYWKAGVCLGLFVDAFKLGS